MVSTRIRLVNNFKPEESEIFSFRCEQVLCKPGYGTNVRLLLQSQRYILIHSIRSNTSVRRSGPQF